MLDAIIGAGIGAGTGAISDAQARKDKDKAEKAGQPPRRRLAKLQEALQGYQATRQVGQSTLAQLAFDMARDVRM